MEIKIKETGEEKTLLAHGVEAEDFTADIIYNYGCKEDFVYNEDDDKYIMTEENYQFWADYFDADEKIWDIVSKMSEEQKDKFYVIRDGLSIDTDAEQIHILLNRAKEIIK